MTKSQYYISLASSGFICLMVIGSMVLTQKMGRDQAEIRENAAIVQQGDQSFKLWQRVATECFAASGVDVNMRNVVMKEGIEPPADYQAPTFPIPPAPTTTTNSIHPSPTPHHP